MSLRQVLSITDRRKRMLILVVLTFAALC